MIPTVLSSLHHLLKTPASFPCLLQLTCICLLAPYPVAAAAPLLCVALGPVSKGFALPLLFLLLLASFPVLLGHAPLSKGLFCSHYHSEYHLTWDMVWSVLASGLQELLSSFFLLLCLFLYRGPPAAEDLVVHCLHYWLPHIKKEVRETWACEHVSQLRSFSKLPPY